MGQSHQALGELIFPSYDSGKFYKNNEDVIFKKKIEQLEKEQLKTDPMKLAQKKLEEELAQKLISLSPYSKAKAIAQQVQLAGANKDALA